mmetsp:Transcript_98476/g.249949  ORF Transcript_98476/g.249949 Transcript_98476/m.249949 type:complete len:235 (+) Transcript_98476:69-773(+)|eukprot:CAMPEP_0183431198 /NCGR_PEP_ID=MMETSP0370-20130417/54665_1 /TAXON_ID=268820 /ORGANISM="Peridinium aciculiferum, Strain PAER-2" /LENGTH=234 /DNA_ID=CAMNT_0025616827 /DNA_START=48 /DNA_END=752 /DNA_ORIENTATION=+
MALRSSLQKCLTPLRAKAPSLVGAWAPARLGTQLQLRSLTVASWKPEARRALVATTQALAKQPAAAAEQPAPTTTQTRSMSNWRLRPYAAAGTAAALPLSSLSAGFSKVSLSLLVLPWKALPTALCLIPVVGVLPAMYRMIFQNSMRHTTASVFTVILYLVLSFMPVPCFENLFSDLFFYGVALVSTFFMYTFFPEVLLHDFMFMHYLALFTIPLIPLAFAYMPMFAARSYLFL